MYKDGAKYNGAWNFGPSDSDLITVEEITKKIVSYWGSGKYKNETSLKNPHEAKLLKLDCSKARSILNWYPVYNIDEALSKTVGWYKMFYDEIGEDNLFEYTIKQIRDYEKRCGYISI